MSSVTTFQPFMRTLIREEQELGKIRKVEIYTTTLNSFNRFLEGKNLLFKEMTPGLVGRYELWLAKSHV